LAGCALLADRAADVLIASVDATSRRYGAAEEQQEAPPLFGEAGLGMPEVLLRFGVHSGDPELETRAAEDAQRFSEAGCIEDAAALAHLEDRLTAAAQQRGEVMQLEGTPAATPQAGDGADQASSEYLTAYLAVTLLAMMAPTVSPVEVFTVPDGFPVQFPVHPEAEIVYSRTSPNLEAEWRVPRTPGAFEAVESFYSERLQTYRTGGWTSSGGPHSVTLGPGNEGVIGQRQFNVAGYGYQGTVVVKAAAGAADVLITAVLTQG